MHARVLPHERSNCRSCTAPLVALLAALSPSALHASPEGSDRADRPTSNEQARDSPSNGDVEDEHREPGDPGDLPKDPDDRPFMDAPNGQVAKRYIEPGPVTPPNSRQRRFQVSVEPLYADLRTRPFAGRPSGPIRGGGIGLEFDVRIVHWLWARAVLSHSVHPLQRVSEWNEEEESLVVLANKGKLRVTHVGGGLAYALDLGRFLPLVDVGGGVLFVAHPQGAAPGQLGGECIEESFCDLGLSCNAEMLCEATPVPEVHAGVGMDVLLGDHWAVGVHVRYHALLSDPASFPVYLTAALRLAARF